MNRRTLMRVSLAVLALVAFGTARLMKLRGAPPDPGAQAGAPLVESANGGFTLGSLAFAPCELAQRNSAATTAAFSVSFEEKRDGM